MGSKNNGKASKRKLTKKEKKERNHLKAVNNKKGSSDNQEYSKDKKAA